MRILIVISALGFGGAERQVMLVSRELVRRGHRVLIYTLTDLVPRRGDLDGSGVELVVDPKRWRLDPLVLARLRRKARDWKADIVHGFLYDGDFYVRVACRGLGMPLLNSERSDNYQLSRLQRLGYRLTARRFDGLVANSHSGANFARRLHGLAASDVHVVWNGIDLDEIDTRLARSTQPAAAWRDTPQTLLCCIVGAIRPLKDHLLALHACRELTARDPRWRFVFIGDSLKGDDSWKRRVLEQRYRLGLEEATVFTGVRTDVPEIVASCDVLLVTSRFEGFSNAVLEAMSCGTPVATTDHSDVRRILPFGWQVAAEREPTQLADIIQRCEREREAVAAAQRRWVERHASVSQSAEAMLDVYRHYLGRPTPAAGPGAVRLPQRSSRS